jgi:hypothetical protein
MAGCSARNEEAFMRLGRLERSGAAMTALLLSMVVPLLSLTGPVAFAANQWASAADSSWEYKAPFFTSSSYDPAIPEPDAFLGFALGSRPLHLGEVWRYLDALSHAGPRVRIEEGGQTVEGRRLAHLIVTSAENQARLEDIRRDIAVLADPRRADSREIDRIVDHAPVVCWLGYSIHGDELSGVDAAVALSYELAASRDTLTERLLRDLVVIIDPSENPDGRERFLTQPTQWKSAVLNPDYRALPHTGMWPWGRGSHYLFDLNRDWIGMVQPETRGRVRTLLTWNPQLVVDVHEMSGLDTYLFSPPREPFNPNLSEANRRWSDLFARDQAASFDRRGWSYYTGEWNEEWYPGYGSSRARYTGAVGILYEEAGVEGSLVRQRDGTVLTYRETVHHQLVSSLANLTTAADHRRELLKGFEHERAGAVATGRSGAIRVFYFVPGPAADRGARLARLLQDEGIEVGVLRGSRSIGDLHDVYGARPQSRTLPAGTYVVSLAQPMGVLARAWLEFDPRMDQSFLESERRELETQGDSRLYEVTAWSLPMAYGLEAYWSGAGPPDDVAPLTSLPEAAGRVENPAAARYGYLIADSLDASMRALALLLQNGAQVRVAKKPFRVEGHSYTRGTILLRRHGNEPGLDELVRHVAEETGVIVRGVDTAKSEERPDLGGDEFRLLEEPRVAVLAGPPLETTSFGSLWWLLDQELALRASLLDVSNLGRVDISKYTVLVIPSAEGGDALKRELGDAGALKIRTWVEAGGTLITLGQASAFAADSTARLSQVRERGQVLADLESYRRDLERENAAKEPRVDSLAVWERPPGEEAKAAPEPAATPEANAAGVPQATEGAAVKAEKPGGDLKVLEEQDRRGRLFGPQGAILRANLDGEHWLTAGLADSLPVMVATGNVFLSKQPVETVARLASAPKLRLSGLLWPEARDRWANSAYLTREARGRGQLILFAGEPQFRGRFLGSMRLLENAILLGPGFGTKQAAPW